MKRILYISTMMLLCSCCTSSAKSAPTPYISIRCTTTPFTSRMTARPTTTEVFNRMNPLNPFNLCHPCSVIIVNKIHQQSIISNQFINNQSEPAPASMPLLNTKTSSLSKTPFRSRIKRIKRIRVSKSFVQFF